MSIASQVLQQGFTSLFQIGAFLGIAAFVMVLITLLANPNAQFVTFAPGESVSLSALYCNKRVILLGPTGLDATVRLPVCGPNATVDFYPATGWPSPTAGFNSVDVQSPSGTAITTNAGDPVSMTYIRKVSCNQISGAWSCVVSQSST